MLIVDEITLRYIGLKHDFKTLAAGCDVDEQNAQLLPVQTLLNPTLEERQRVLNVVNVHHHKSRQVCCSLLAPGTSLAALRGGHVKGGLKDEGWQLALQLSVACLAELVDVLRPLRGPDERKELRFVNGQRRIYKTLLIAKHIIFLLNITRLHV